MADRTCAVEGCQRPMNTRGWCRLHYTRWLRHGDPVILLRSRTAVCSVAGCTRRHSARGLCGTHYERWRRHGDPNVNLWTGRTLAERFWPKVNKTETCWLWTASKNHLGYGQFFIAPDAPVRRAMAHRFAWELLRGPIPDGLELDHLCRVPSCVNPDHLEPVTHAENLRRAPWSAAAYQRAKTRCPYGHEYTPENTFIKSGTYGRECRTCRATRRRRRPCRESASTGHAGF